MKYNVFNEKNKKFVTKYKKTGGITLVALVVTIVVLLILAGVTITMLFGENGIIKKAQEAKEETERDQQETQQGLQDLNDQMSTILNGNDGATPVDVATLTTFVTKNTEAVDTNGNKIVVPEGFKVLTSEGTTVQEGIVIQDEDGNEFVWIPVGTIKNADGSTNTIELARYTFDITLDSDTEEISGGTGAVKSKITDGSALTDEVIEAFGEDFEYLEEPATSTTYDNTKAKDIEGFKRSVSQNEGYYIARYEASYRDGTKPYSKPSIGTPDETDGSTIAEGMLWNWITQPDAATASRNMYSSSSFESDLVNSYAWDTAIVFIQTYGDSDYSMQTSLNSTLGNTGTRSDGTTDKVCNIFDMASNTVEWTTETSTLTTSGYAYPCVLRGGYCNISNYYTAIRYSYDATYSNNYFSFRVALYVNQQH